MVNNKICPNWNICEFAECVGKQPHLENHECGLGHQPMQFYRILSCKNSKKCIQIPMNLIFECEDIRKKKFNVEISLTQLLNELKCISHNGRVDAVLNMYIKDTLEGRDVYGSLQEHFENTCDGYCESMSDQEFKWLVDALVIKTKEYFCKKIRDMV